MLTDRFIHLHIPRTAGGTFRTLIRRLIGDEGCLGCRIVDWTPHESWCWYERKAREARIPVPPAFAFIRNPYEWYVSAYLYLVKQEAEGGIDPRLSFEKWMEGLNRGRFDYRYYKTLTYLWTEAGADRVNYVGQFEHLEQCVVGLTSMFLFGLVPQEKILKVFQSLPQQQQAQQEGWHYPYPYREFHTIQTRRWVEEWDTGLLIRFKYRW